ncbi:hypothetical protein LPLAFNJD_LOCUS2343 [Methylorubrum aminovorans]
MLLFLRRTIFGCVVLALAGALSSSELAAQNLNQMWGQAVCAMATVQQVREVFRSESTLLKTVDQDHDEHCQSYYRNILRSTDGLRYYRVPSGLEAWAIKKLRSDGYRAYHVLSPPGGSGTFRAYIPKAKIGLESISPQTFSTTHQQLACSTQKVLEQYFAEVRVEKACRGSGSLANDMCLTVWLGDHLARSRGLSPKNLQNLVGPHYYFSSKAQILFSDIYLDQRRDSYLLLEYIVQSTRFARRPSSSPTPQGSDYAYISEFDKSVDPDEVDQLINEQIGPLLERGPLTCSRS